MTMVAPEPPAMPDDLLDVFANLNVPEGYRAELIEGEIVVSPPPDGNLEDIVARVIRRIARSSRTEQYGSGTKGIVTPSGRFIPDITVAAEGVFGDREPWMDPDGVSMVVEVTSGQPLGDREIKRRGYAAADIPLYLLVDRSAGEVVLYGAPRDGDYRADTRVPFGKPLDLPDPFGFTLETEPFT